MKEFIQYRCEYCGAMYDQQDRCAKCEANHEIPVGITKFMHCKEGERVDSRYPHSVVIKFQNGASIVYKKG